MSTRREFLVRSTSAAAAFTVRGASGAERSGKSGADKPNIVLILADDMGFSDIGCFGSEIATPNIDKLAAGGMRINQFYNNPRCCPSRASILTGLYPHQAGFGMMADDYGRYPWPQYAGDLSPKCVTIAEALKPAGYKCAIAGKWHQTSQTQDLGKHNWPLQRGFDRFWGTIAGASSYYNPATLVSDNEHISPPADPNFYYADAIADHAAGFVKEFAAEKSPFFVYCAFTTPHWPMQVPEADVQKYAKRYAEGWDKLRVERHRKQIAEGIVEAKWPLTPRDPRVPAWENASYKDWEMRRMAVYAAMIERMDAGIGRLVKSIEDAGVAENTLIIFMADNGGNAEEMGDPGPNAPRPIYIPARTKDGTREVIRGNKPEVMPGPEDTYQSVGIPWGNCTNTPFRLYKHYAHEGGISSPFVAYWPKKIKPTKRPLSSVGHETDLMPTFLEMAGATYPKSTKAGPIPDLAGQSLMPLFLGKPRTRKTIFWEHEGNKAVRDGKWKLVSRFPDAWELYDMETDRTEMHDLAAAQPARVKTMAAMYDNWAKEIGVQPWPMPQTPKHQRSGAMLTPDYLKKDQGK
ncbi:MAG: arylsulfatase [Acidobacteria bacterium]|nr:arylsulfatase [Acidobacteriota bacterium]